MIKIFRLDKDSLHEVEGLDALDPAADTAWIDLSSPTREEDKAVEAFLGISIPTREDMEEIELSNRLYAEDGAQFMTMLAVSLVKAEDPLKCPVTFILRGRMLVTVRYEDFLSIPMYLQSATRKGGVPLPSSHGIMLSLLESFVNRIADSLELAGSEIDRISLEIFRSKKHSPDRKNKIMQISIGRIGAKGDLISMLRESLSSISRLLIHYAAELPETESRAVRPRISSLNKDVASLGEHANFLSNKMGFLLDATLGLINLEQNQIIKIFSIAAVVFLPPTLVASIYGMNFTHMPELDWRIGYPLALCAMIVSALLPLYYFKKKGWL